jgi:hypothetical protein
MGEENPAICDWGILTKALYAQQAGWTVDRRSLRSSIDLTRLACTATRPDIASRGGKLLLSCPLNALRSNGNRYSVFHPYRGRVGRLARKTHLRDCSSQPGTFAYPREKTDIPVPRVREAILNNGRTGGLVGYRMIARAPPIHSKNQLNHIEQATHTRRRHPLCKAAQSVFHRIDKPGPFPLLKESP